MKIGVHVSIAGKISEAIFHAESLGCNAIQIFSRNPRMWEQKKLSNDDASEFREKLKQSSIVSAFIHVPYLTNLASPDRAVFENSIRCFVEYIREAEALGIDYLVTHMGSHKKDGEPRGLGRLSRAINIIFERTKKSKVTLLLENTAGSGSWLGYRLSHHQRVIDKIENKDRVGICIDTCHAFAAGYNIALKEGLENFVAEIEELIGMEKLKLIHLNDSQDPLSSKRDRHAHIGEGTLGLKTFENIVNHPKLKDIPFILETPKMTQEDDLRNLETIRHLCLTQLMESKS